ncbi:MAG: tetratricopeptide repeat protein [Tepidiformaceae bacterium]
MPEVGAALDVTDATFATEVLERSKAVAVVVDFWAPWCGPCRVLGPIIERVAAEHSGDVVLAKLNTDENPMVATQFRIQGIPAVKAFRGGSMVAEFTGALPEPQVRAFFAKLVPTEAERTARRASEMLDAGDFSGAENHFREVLAKSPGNPDAATGLAAILLARGEEGAAEELLDRVPTDRRSKLMKHGLFLDRFAKKHAAEDLELEATSAPADPRAMYRCGVMLAARQQFEPALDELLESARLDRAFADGAARKAMLAVFDLLGPDSPMTREYQRQLSRVLF